jgi:hypothetical protein
MLILRPSSRFLFQACLRASGKAFHVNRGYFIIVRILFQLTKRTAMNNSRDGNGKPPPTPRTPCCSINQGGACSVQRDEDEGRGTDALQKKRPTEVSRCIDVRM